MGKRVVILGGGFAGVYAAMHLEKLLGKNGGAEITLINSENYFVFQPMLPEVISGGIQIQNIINPIRRLCPGTNLHVREVESIDLEKKVVNTSTGFRPVPHAVSYDHLVMALGTTMNFSRLPGLQQHGFSFKNLGDALHLRNHVIHILAEADMERDPEFQRTLLTFIIAGGGFSGVEVAAELNDFVRAVAPAYRNLDREMIRVVILHSGDLILPELSEPLRRFGEKLLQRRGIEIRYQTRLAGATGEAALLRGGEKIPTKTLIATVPSGPHLIVAGLPCRQEKGRIVVDEFLEVPGYQGLWALGDCARIPDLRTGGFCPPTAQYALRQGRQVAANIAASLGQGEKKPFEFSALGVAAVLGHHSAVVELFGTLKLSGFLAWLMWRAIYWSKLPGLERKFRVGVDWLMDILLSPDIVQIKTGLSHGVGQEHYESGEVIFRQGDVGDRVYTLIAGEVEVVREENGRIRRLARLGSGDCFGEMALLSDEPRNATVVALDSVDAMCIYRRDFEALANHLPGMRQIFLQVMQKHLSRQDSAGDGVTKGRGQDD